MTHEPFIIWLDDKSAPGSRLLGGKFASLAQSTAAGLPVPTGFGITTAAYRQFLTAANLDAEARRVREAAATVDVSEIGAESAQLRRAFMTAPLPAELERDVRNSYKLLAQRTGTADVPVAVRSSGESEDLAGASFAGQYETFLWIRGADDLLQHVRSCWAGMFNDAVLSYRHEGEALAATIDLGICVGVQEMVDARAAGVMFTLDPINGDRSKIVIEACWGLGEGVVKGDITPSQFSVDKVTFEVGKRCVSSQGEEYRFDPSSGTVRMLPVASDRRDTVCLSDDHLRELAELAKNIEKDRGAPQDIEWACNGRGEIRVLQVRPETVWSRRPAAALVAKAKSPVAHVLARLSGVRMVQPAAADGSR